MAENLKITQAQEENTNEFGREHNEKLQSLARSLVAGLYMLVRSVKMYDPENAVFQKPLHQLQDIINQIIGKEGRLELTGVKESFYLNGMLVKVDLNSIENQRYLLSEMRSKDVGGFTLTKPVTVPELKNFVWIFSKEQTAASEEDGLSNRKLLNMRVAKFSKIKEKLNKDLDNPGDQKVDRKKYAMTIYARAVFFLSKYLESVRAGKPINASKALRLVQDFVDISYEQRTHFLGMTTMRREDDYLVYHQVNVCLMSVVFGAELGLTKPQLRDLGYIALFHDAGMATLSEELSTKRGALTAEEKLVVQRAPLVSVRNILMEKGFSRSTLLRVVTTFEHKTDFGTAVRDSRGNIQMIIPKTNLGVYAKVIAICDAYDALTSKRPYRDAYGPEVALMLMWSEMRNKFDPELLSVFMRVMAIQPVKVLSKRQQSLSVSGL
ncbi:Glutamate synthase [NADPH] large chain [Myxococcus hansupus]|uniref:Glutamate synthase [NADPH] large chain n=1 Tax=Pseudomyxococcus hansupus TaxID=1297742 RepID=A0A0H4WV42_9BACT|nr:HD domain-containing phosphohydrolase [Myxococcus hansupus]AKQ66684.1 Glutamate synthase [NADPH] large chain [Myxococcus hansupus]